MSDDTLEDINSSVVRRDSLGADLEENSACQTLDETNFSDDSDFDSIFDDPGPYGRVLRALAALEEKQASLERENEALGARIEKLEVARTEALEQREKLERVNEALREIVSRLEPGVWQMLTDDGWWGDVPEERRESETARALEGIEYRRERQRSLLVYGDVLKSIARKAERGHDPAKSTELKIAVIFDNLHKNGNRPVYIPNLPLGDGGHNTLSKRQRERLVGYLRLDPRFEVGLAPPIAFYGGRLKKEYRKGLFVWLKGNEARWDRPVLR